MLKKLVVCAALTACITAAPFTVSAEDAGGDNSGKASGKVTAEAVPLGSSRTMKAEKATPAKIEDLEKGGAPASDRPPRMAPEEAKKSGAGIHVVIKGDTLWDLSGRYLNNPFMWNEVWKVNPHIHNPNLIYPGDEVIMPGMAPGGMARGPGARDGAMAGEQAGTRTRYQETFDKGEPFVDMGHTVIKMDDKGNKIISLDTQKQEKLPITTLSEVLNAGFLKEDIRTFDWAGPREPGRLYYTVGDEMLVGQDPDLKPGDYLVTALVHDLDHPTEFFHDLGDYIEPTGMIQIKETGGDYYIAEVVLSLRDISEDDVLIRFDPPEEVFLPVPKNRRLKGKWGYVVSAKWDKTNTEQSNYVYIDLGAIDGAKTGDVFEIWREEPSDLRFVKREDEKWYRLRSFDRPETYIGEAIVIYVGDKSSTARVVVSDKPLVDGYRAYYKD